MNRKQLSSGTLASAGYDHVSAILELEFVSGRIYKYSGVPASVFHELIEASSHGEFFNKQIRGKYPYVEA